MTCKVSAYANASIDRDGIEGPASALNRLVELFDAFGFGQIDLHGFDRCPGLAYLGRGLCDPIVFRGHQ
jgi:hypothetical protein